MSAGVRTILEDVAMLRKALVVEKREGVGLGGLERRGRDGGRGDRGGVRSCLSLSRAVGRRGLRRGRRCIHIYTNSIVNEEEETDI